MDKEQVIDFYKLTKGQTQLIDLYLEKLKKTNKNINLVGSSTLKYPWDRHINDSLQLSKFIKNKDSRIVDFGTGAGIPGLLLNIYGYKNIILIDSKLKKIQFINSFISEFQISAKTICKRVDAIKNIKTDYIICRALSPLINLLNYSLFFSKSNTTLLFLKGRNVNTEILHAKKNFDFYYKLYESKSQGDGFILEINKLVKL